MNGLSNKQQVILEVLRQLTIVLPDHIKYIITFNEKKDNFIDSECHKLLEIVEEAESSIRKIMND